MVARSIATNGGTPANISYNKAPKLQKSAALSCPVDISTSGATYSGVPQVVYAFSSPEGQIWVEQTPCKKLDHHEYLVLRDQSPSVLNALLYLTKYFPASSPDKLFLFDANNQARGATQPHKI